MERYVAIGKNNLRHNIWPYLLIGLLHLFCMPLVTGIQNLNEVKTARVLEMYTSLAGIILFISVYRPDQDKNILDLIQSKYTPMMVTHLIRSLQAAAGLIFLTGGAVLMLQLGGCRFPAGLFFAGTLAGAVFLGGLGSFAYALFDNIAIACMIPLVYYMMNISGSAYVGKFYLFSMMRGSFEEKLYLGITGTVLVAAGILWRFYKRKRM